MEITYSVSEIDEDTGLIILKIVYPDGSSEDYPVDAYSVTTSPDDPLTLVKNNLDQIVQARFVVLYPPARFLPESLGELVGKSQVVQV